MKGKFLLLISHAVYGTLPWQPDFTEAFVILLSLTSVSKQKKIKLEANEFLQGEKKSLTIYKLEGVVNKGMVLEVGYEEYRGCFEENTEVGT